MTLSKRDDHAARVASFIELAEVVIEETWLGLVRMAPHTGKAMPEFPGYTGDANPSLPVIKVTAIMTRRKPILQTLVGPGEEHVSLAGISTEASIHNACEGALPGDGARARSVADASYNPRLPTKGTTCKTVFDCTVPFHLREHFVRARFKEIDSSLWAPELFGTPTRSTSGA
jgi:3-octaprenyl-4-hydroxybenzoate carboxy-lyase